MTIMLKKSGAIILKIILSRLNRSILVVIMVALAKTLLPQLEHLKVTDSLLLSFLIDKLESYSTIKDNHNVQHNSHSGCFMP